MALTDKQKLFADEYLIDLNATRAYKAVYKSCKKDETARVNGSRLLTNANIVSYIEQRMKDREKRTEITQDKVLRELAKIGFANLNDYLEYKTAKTVVSHDEETGEPIIDYQQIIDVLDSKDVDTSVIQEVSIGKDGTFKFKLYDKQKALELIGKHLGMFSDTLKLKGDTNTEVTIKIGGEDYGD
jgi:phage terminase small subunit